VQRCAFACQGSTVLQRGRALLAHSSSSLGAYCLLLCSSRSCSICANYFSGVSSSLAKMAELFHPVIILGVFSVFSPIPTRLSCTASPTDHLLLPRYLVSSTWHHPATCYLPTRGCFCVYHSAIARVAQQRGGFPMGFVIFWNKQPSGMLFSIPSDRL